MERNTNYTDSNLFEILVFTSGRYQFGINLAKVKEIIKYETSSPIPYSHPVIEGVFEIRNTLIPLINLRRWLDLPEEPGQQYKIIITEFLGINIGFKVDNVERIHKIPWSDVNPPEKVVNFTPTVLGTVKLGERLINLLDYESIVLGINPNLFFSSSIQKDESEEMKSERESFILWIAEDSETIRTYVTAILTESGYKNFRFFPNGEELYNEARNIKSKVHEQVNIIITDIEMPKMNGYTLLGHIKQNPQLKHLPTIIFSSIITNENKLKGELLEADAQLSKADSTSLVHVMDRLLIN